MQNWDTGAVEDAKRLFRVSSRGSEGGQRGNQRGDQPGDQQSNIALQAIKCLETLPQAPCHILIHRPLKVVAEECFMHQAVGVGRRQGSVPKKPFLSRTNTGQLTP